MATPETEEDIMLNDKDPMEALREIRRDEGVAEEDLPERVSDVTDTDVLENVETEAIVEEETNDEKNETETEEAGTEEDNTPGSESDSDATKDSEPVDGETDGDTDGEESKAVASRKFRANNQEFEFTEQEMIEQFETIFGQSMNYTQKMQKIAPYRKMISALEQEGVTQESLNLALDALKGDKGAIKKLLENNKLDAYDLTAKEDEDEDYTPNTYGKDETTLEIEEITSKISQDTEFAITTNVIDEQWDSSSRQVIAKNPNMITGLHNDIKAGIYDKVAPAAMKMKVLDGNTKSDIEYYILAGEQLRISMEAEAKKTDGQNKVDELNADAQGADDKFDKASSEAKRKRSANSTGARADSKGVMDYLDDDDEAYEEWYKKLQSSI